LGFNPLNEKGIPIDKQLRNWSQLNVQPYDKMTVDPYTRCRIIVMNGIEVEAAIFSHQFNRNTDVPEVKEKLAMSRRIEQQQQKVVNWLTPGDETTLEVTLGYEQVAIDLTAWLARAEPNPTSSRRWTSACSRTSTTCTGTPTCTSCSRASRPSRSCTG